MILQFKPEQGPEGLRGPAGRCNHLSAPPPVVILFSCCEPDTSCVFIQKPSDVCPGPDGHFWTHMKAAGRPTWCCLTTVSPDRMASSSLFLHPLFQFSSHLDAERENDDCDFQPLESKLALTSSHSVAGDGAMPTKEQKGQG